MFCKKLKLYFRLKQISLHVDQKKTVIVFSKWVNLEQLILSHVSRARHATIESFPVLLLALVSYPTKRFFGPEIENYHILPETLEFSMELKIPVCALKGLELQDVKFNDDSECNAVAEQVGDHFHWVIDYNDCGTKKSVS